MNKMKRYLAILLTVLMMINMLPVSAIADTTYSEWTDPANGVKVVAEGEERTVYNVGITFIYQDLGTMAKEPVIEEVEAGGSLNYTDLPTEPGFLCYMGDDNLNVSGSPISAVTVNNVSEDMALVVVLVPQETQYQVEHSFETTTGTYGNSESEMKTGIVRTMTNAEPKDKLGYIPNSFVQEKIEWWDEAVHTGTTVDITYDYIDYTVNFDADGGTFTDPIELNVDGNINFNNITEPTKVGYDFDGWYYTDGEGNEVEATGTMTGATIAGLCEKNDPSDEMTFVAHWTAQDVEYTVVYWQQKVTDDVNATDAQKTYDFLAAESKTAAIGATINPSTYSAGKLARGFKYNSNKSVSVTVKADGTTVVNVYYDRVKCTVNFYTGATSSNASTSSYNKTPWKTVTGLFGADLPSGAWDTSTYAWRQPSGSSWGGTSWSGCILLTSFDFETAGYDYTGSDNTDQTCNFYSKDKGSYTLTYYKEKYDGTYEEAVSVVTSGSTTLYDKFEGWSIYTQTSSIGNNDNPTTAAFWDSKTKVTSGSSSANYKNNRCYVSNKLDTKTLSFYNYNAVSKTVENIKYTTPLSDYAQGGKSYYTPPRPEGLPAYYEFKGWYADSACTVEYDFANATMPNNNLQVYAKWEKAEYNVTIHWNNGDEDTVLENVLGGSTLTAEQVPTPTNAGYDFKGWYLDEDMTQPYSLSKEVTGNIDIYAKWERKTYLDFTVYYVKQGTPDSGLKDSANWVRNPDQMRAPMQDKTEGTNAGYVTVAAKDPTVENYTTWIYDEPFKLVDVSQDTGSELYQVFYYRQPQKEYYQVRYYYVDDAGVTHYVKVDEVKNNATTTSSGVESYKYSILEKLTPPSGFTCAPYTYVTRFNVDASNPAQTDVEVKLIETTVSGTKTWVDSSNAYGTRPANTTIELVKAGAAVDKHVLATSATTENTESFSWTKPLYDITYSDCDGKTPGTYVSVSEISYSVREAGVTNNVLPGVGADYAVTVDGNNITNTLTGGKVNVTVTKIWDDNSDATAQRPASVTINLYGTDKTTAVESEAVTASTNWTYTFEDVAKFENGALISYTVDETAVPNYTSGTPVKVSDNNWKITNSIQTGTLVIDKIVTGLPTGVANSDEFTFKVTTAEGVEYIAETAAATVDENVTIEGVPAGSYVVTEIDGSANWEHEYTMPAAGTTVTVLAGSSVTAQVTNAAIDTYKDGVTVTKNWLDNSNAYATRPEDLTVTVSGEGFEYEVSAAEDADAAWTKNGNTWTATIDGVRKYTDAGVEVVYDAVEVTPDGYTCTIDAGSVTEGFTFTNLLTKTIASVPVTKVWDDASNQDGKRPQTLTVNLVGDGKTYSTTLSGTADSWSGAIANVPKYNASGAEIVYTVTEDTIEGYTMTSATGTLETGYTVTNVHTPATTEVSGTKSWVDQGTVTRPTSVTVNLLADGEVIKTTTATAEGGWTYSFTNLPVYKAGTVIVYTVEEANVDANYVPTVDADDNITNTVKTGTLKITKDVTGLPAKLEKVDSFQFSVTSKMTGATYSVAATDAITDGETVTINNIPVGEYTVAEITTGEFEHEYIFAAAQDVTVVAGATAAVTMTNAAIDKADEVTVTKIWDDASNQDGKRPADLTVTLTSGEFVYTVSGAQWTKSGNEWTATLEDTVRLYADGEDGAKLTYTVTESDPNTNGGHYTQVSTTFVPVDAKTVSLTNTHTPATIPEFTITKQWDDGSNVGGIRPASVAVQLYKTVDGVTAAVGQPVTVTGTGDSWIYTYNNLPVYERGFVIDYSVKEAGTTTTDGVEYLASTEAGRDYVVTYPDAKTIVNSYDPDDFRITVTANKQWLDKWLDNVVEVADADVTTGKIGAQLYQKIGEGEFVAYGAEAELTKVDGEYTYTWTDLPKYTLVDGTWVENAWQIKESTVPAGWLNNGEAVAAAATGTKYALSATLVNTREYAEINAQKTWNDADNAANLRPASGNFTIDLKNGEQTYTFTFDADLTGNVWTSNNTLSVPTYELGGTPIVYTLAEADAVVTNYTMAPANWTADAKDTTVEVSNTIKGGQSLTVTKEVTYTTPDGLTEDAASKIFEAVDFTFTVTTANGTRVSGVPYTKTTAAGTETGTLTDGTFTLKHGEQITISELKVGTYTVVETDANDFTCVDAEQSANVSETAQTLNFTNKRDVTTEEEAITLKKNWKDAGDDTKRPESLSLKLVGRADGAVVYSAALTLTAAANWTMDVSGLPKTLNNVAIAYELVEENVPNGYEQIDDGKAYEVTNVRTGTDDVVFTKTWNDDLTEARRPSTADFAAMLALTDDEQTDLSAKVPSITVDEENDVWTFTYTGMEMFDAEGNVIVYTLTETLTGDTAAWYTADKAVATWNYNSAANNGLENTLKTVTVTVEKKVEDETGEDYSNTQFAITANASYASVAGTSDMAEKAESLKDNGSFTYEVPFGATVTVAEDEVAWTESFSANNGAAFNADGTITVTNTRILVDGGITVTKVWNDASDQDGVRPESVAMTLMQNGVEYTTNSDITAKVDVIGTTNEWTYTWTGMPMYDQSGAKYIYTVVEDAVAEYTAEPADMTADEDNDWTITNIHEIDTTEVTVTKVWDDADDQDGYRPESVEITLYDDGEAIDTAVLTAANEWTYTWEDLPVNNATAETDAKDGTYVASPIVYTVDELVVPDEYTKSITGDQANGYTVTNTHEIDTTTVTVTKEWVDETIDTIPESVTVQLLDDGEVCGDAIVLNAENEWTYTWTDLPVNNATDAEDAKDGTYEAAPISYTVIETKIGDVAVVAGTDSAAGYDIAITGTQADGYIITNTRQTVELTLKKRWIDNNNEQGTRPAINVIVERKDANGEYVAVLTSDNKAVRYDEQIVDEKTDFVITEFEGKALPKTDLDGTPIEYRVNEEPSEVLKDTVYEKDAEYEQASIVVDGTATTVVNQLKKGEAEIGFTKVWVDNGNEQGFRPAASVAGYGAWLTLYQSTDQVNWTALTTAATTVAVAGDNTDAYTIEYTGLDRFDKDGKLYYYAVAETIPAEGIVSDYKQSGASIAVADGVEAVAPNGILTNTLTGETVDVTITKYWLDGDGNTLEVIPVDTLYVALSRITNNDEEAKGFSGGYTSLTDEGWTTTLTVEKYDKVGALYVFDVVEYATEEAYTADFAANTLTGAVGSSATFAGKDYSVAYNTASLNNLTITNVRGDDEEQDPEKTVTDIQYHAYVDGEKVDVGDSWTYTITWTNNTNKEQVVTITDIVEDYLTVSGTTAAFDVTANAEIADAAAAVNGQNVEWQFTAKPFHNGYVTLTVTLNALPNEEGKQIAENTAIVNIGNDEDITNTPTVELADPDFTVEKEVLNEKVAYELGDTVEYKVTVTNTGNLTLFNLDVLDKVNLGDEDDEETQVSETIESLAPAAVWTKTYSYVVDENDLERGSIYNKVTVNCIDPTSEAGDPMDERSDDETVQTVQMAPAIAVEKKVVDKQDYYTEGETVTFEITVSNTGNRTLYDVTLTDSMSNGGIVEVAESDAYTVSTDEDGNVVVTLAEALEPAVVNEAKSTFTFQVTYDVTRVDLGEKKITNFVTAEGTTEDNDTVTDDDEAEASFTTDKLIIYTVTKIWDDNEDALGVRPESVTVQLYRNGEAYDAAQDITEDENGQWTVTYPNLPYTDADHVKFDYTVEETKIGSLTVEDHKGYTVTPSAETVTDGVSEAITITNSIVTVDVTVTKEWRDGEGNLITDTENDIPASLTMDLTNNKAVVSGTKAKADADVKDGATWTYTFTGLPMYDADCNELVYTATEGETEGYTPAEDIVERALTIVDGAATFVNVKDDETQTPPDKEMVEESTPTIEVMLGDSSEFMAVNGETITYTIAWSNNYATDRAVTVIDHLPTGLNYSGSYSNVDTDNGAAVETTVSQDGQDVTFTFEAKPFQDGVITLTVNVDRQAIIDAYGSADDPTVTNEAEMIVAGDETERDFDEVTVSVYNPIITVDKSIEGESHNANGYQVGETIEYQVVVTNDGNVPLVDIKVKDTLVAQSEETFTLDIGESKTFTYEYKVTPEDVTAGEVDNTFTATGKPDAVTDEGEAVEDVTDSDSETAVTYEAKGSWIPEDEAGTILKTLEGAELTDGQFRFTITDVTNNITINGSSDAEGKVTFDGEFEYTLEDMPTHDDFEATNPGAAYTGTFTYELVEVNTGDDSVDYTKDKYTFEITYTDNNAGVLEITEITMNGEEYTGEAITFDNYMHIDAVVTKTWENVDLIDIPEVTITLYRKVLGADETAPTTADAIDDSWTVIGSKVIADGKAEWTNLERVDADANDGVYTYIATESVAANADAAFTASAEVVVLSEPVDNVKSAGFTNSRDMGSAEEANLTVTKTVVNNDGELTDEMESDKFDFTVIVPSDLTVGDSIAYTIGDAEFTAAIQSGENGKFFVITGVKHGETASVTTQLPVGTYTISEQQQSGNAYNYTVAYDKTSADLAKKGTVAFEVTNTSNSNGFSIGKLWKQPNGASATATAFDYDTEAANTATFGLFYDEAATQPVKQNGVDLVAVTDENGVATFNDVAYSTGAVYYIKEIATTVEDSYVINTTAVKVEWDGEKFVVAADAVTNELQTRELTIEKVIDWNGTIKESTSFDITFSYKLPGGEAVEGYVTAAYDAESDAITYTTTIGETTVAGNVLTVPYGTEITVDEQPTAAWTKAIAGLDEGEAFVTVNDNKEVEVTNTRVLTTLSFTKVWVDAGNALKTRPKTITVEARRLTDGEYVAVTGDDNAHGRKNEVLTVAAEDSTEYDELFAEANLPMYDIEGNLHDYIVAEPDAVIAGNGANYDSVVDGATVTNTLTQETVTVSGTKTWNMIEGEKTPDITIRLYRDGVEIASKTIENATGYTFDNLPKYAVGTIDGYKGEYDGHRFTYSVSEDPINGYTSVNEGVSESNTAYVADNQTDFTNTADETEVLVTKKWIDGDRNPLAEELIPESLTVQLKRNDKAYLEAVVMTAENKVAESTWQYKFTGLPTHDENGAAYTYSVEEEQVEAFTADALTVAVKDGKAELVNTKDTEEKQDPSKEDTAVTETAIYYEGENGEKREVVVGAEITYTITYTNNNNTRETVTITDKVPTGTEFVKASDDGELVNGVVTWKLDVAPFTTDSVTVTFRVTEAALNGAVADPQIENTASVQIGDDPAVDAEAGDISVYNPELSIDKTVENEQEIYVLGDTIQYKVVVTNTGNVTLTDVEVTDNRVDLTADMFAATTGATFDDEANTVSVMKPGDAVTFTYTVEVTEAIILEAGNTVVNVAAAKADDPFTEEEDEDISATDTEDVEIEEPNPSIDVVKTTEGEAPEGGYKLGDMIFYNIVVTNNGNMTLTNVKVVDELIGLNETIAILVPGAEAYFFGGYEVTEDDLFLENVVNVATAGGDDPTGENPEDEDKVEDPTEDPDPSFTVVKTLVNLPERGYFVLGETAKFEITVTNTGNLTLSNITVNEELEGATFTATAIEGVTYSEDKTSATIETLAPMGDEVVLYAEYTITEADLGKTENLGSEDAVHNLKNTLTAEGTPYDPEDPDPIDPDPIDPEPIPVDEVTTVTVNKIWDDQDNAFETRQAITVHLIADGNVEEPWKTATIEADEEGNWSYTFVKLPVHNADAEEIVYTVVEDAVPGYDTEYSEAEDGSLVITNTLQQYTLTVRYWYEKIGGEVAASTFTRTYFYGESYNVVSPKITGYRADKTAVSGIITEDTEYDVIYKAINYRLTIYYVYEDGTTAAPTYIKRTMNVGDDYDIASPYIEGYVANTKVVSGTMPAHNMVYTVIYVPATVVIDEYGVPLNIGSVVMNVGDCFE